MEELTGEDLIKKQIRMNRLKTWTNIFLILIIALISAYIFKEIESFKALGRDVCTFCEAKTGAVCFMP